MTTPEVEDALRRLMVDLECPAALDEWRLDRRREAPRDAHGNEVEAAA